MAPLGVRDDVEAEVAPADDLASPIDEKAKAAVAVCTTINAFRGEAPPDGSAEDALHLRSRYVRIGVDDELPGRDRRARLGGDRPGGGEERGGQAAEEG